MDFQSVRIRKSDGLEVHPTEYVCNTMAADTDRPPGDDYLPAASIEMLRLRSALLGVTRRFFESHGYWEVETPVLSHDTVIDAHLEPFAVQANDGPGRRPTLFLQTSPEFAMKRLLAAGADAIFQIGRAFRQGELGRYHNPEFTMIEWYRIGDTHHRQMEFVEEYVSAVFAALPEAAASAGVVLNQAAITACLRPFGRLTYDEAFQRETGTRAMQSSVAELAELARRRNVAVPESLADCSSVEQPGCCDAWLNLLLAELVEPNLGRERPEFVYDYPASQGALARLRDETPAVAERFELYVRGVEVCNGYHELTDARELRQRFARQSEIRAQEGHPPLPMENRLLAAIEQKGLPPCAGVALGFDRLVMLAVGAESLAEVMAFPFERA